MPRLLSLILILATFFVNDLSGQVLVSRKMKAIAPKVEVTAEVSTQTLLFNLKNMAKDEYSIYVFNVEGRNVITESMTNGYARNFEMGLKLSKLQPSTYYYSFVNSKGAVKNLGKFDILDDRNMLIDEEFGLKTKAISGSSQTTDKPYNNDYSSTETIVPMIIRDIYNERYFSMVILQQEDSVAVGFDTSRQLSPGVYYVVGSGSQELDINKMVIR